MNCKNSRPGGRIKNDNRKCVEKGILDKKDEIIGAGCSVLVLRTNEGSRPVINRARDVVRNVNRERMGSRERAEMLVGLPHQELEPEVIHAGFEV